MFSIQIANAFRTEATMLWIVWIFGTRGHFNSRYTLSWSYTLGIQNFSIAVKFDYRFGSIVAESPTKFQSDMAILAHNLACSTPCEIEWKYILPEIKTAPMTFSATILTCMNCEFIHQECLHV